MKKIRFVGDTIFINNINRYISDNYLWVINLESSLESKKPISKTVNLFSDENKLYKRNIILNLANNHTMDFGREGLMKLLALLERKNIKYYGAGMDIDKAIKPCIININNKKIGFLGFAWNVIQSIYATEKREGVAPLNERIIKKSIMKYKKKVDFLFISLHMGYEYEKYAIPAHRILAHKMIDWGGDLIIGHHPHLFQGRETYKGKSIYYSLGNYYMPRMQIGRKTLQFKNESNIGLVLDISVKDNLFKIKELFSYYDQEMDKIEIIENYIQKNKLNILSAPYKYSDKEYLKYFLKNRKRKMLLPIYTGSENDCIRNIYMKLRTKIIEIIRR